LFLDNAFEQVKYLGYGPFESYADKHQASYFGLFASTVTALHEDYIRPQENGSHFGCQWVSLHNGKMALMCWGGQPLSFSVSHFTQEELAQKGHNHELVPCGNTVLCLDYKQAGIGSNSCGPELDRRYQLCEKMWKWGVTLSPSMLDTHDSGSTHKYQTAE
jgi:beta-galactosidase